MSRFLILITLIIATLIRFYQLDGQSLWSDEGNSYALVQASFADIANRTAFDIHPPLYYWLLKVWVLFVGESEFGLRAFSAFLGVLSISLIYQLGRQFFGQTVGHTSALIAALSPFQVYYAQEARMYMLLMVFSLLAVWFALEILFSSQSKNRRNIFIVSYVLTVTLGLYTQYAFPIVLVAINITAIIFLWPISANLVRWIGLQFLTLILYLPWLPIAYRQITTWPSLVESATASQIVLTLAQTISLGLSATAVSAGWLFLFGGLLVLGLVPSWQTVIGNHKQRYAFILTMLWLFLPAALTAFFFRPAYLKIFLIASPAFCLLVGRGIVSLSFGKHQPGVRWLSLLALVGVVWSSLQSLYGYQTDPIFHRDNYRGIVRFIEAIATPRDAVLIHAAGQQDVFYYYFGQQEDQPQIYPLPKKRPLDETETVRDLAQIARQSERLFGVYWATSEADPAGVIEGWLDQHTFKASDTWFGSVRLVSYATAEAPLPIIETKHAFENGITLTGYGLSHHEIMAGEILEIQLVWQTDQPVTENYTVFVQLLNEANYLVGQRDAAPLIPTSAWRPNISVTDNHGLYLEPGTPPGTERLIVGLYDADTGARLQLNNGQDFVWLDQIQVVKNQTPLPFEAYHIQHHLNSPPLVGYDLYKRGYASKPETPLYPGDLLHLNLYWQKSTIMEDQLEIRLLNAQGVPLVTWQGQPAGIDYPMSEWAEGEIIRGQFDIFLAGVSPGRYAVEIVLGSNYSERIGTVVIEKG